MPRWRHWWRPGKVVGCNALIYQGQREIYYGQWGMRDREKKRPLTRDTIFRIYSMSKPITSVAVMQLVEQGQIDLDTPLHQYLPALADVKVLVPADDDTDAEMIEVAAKRPITPRDLLRHTSGFTYGVFGNSPVDRRYRGAGVLMTDKTIAETVDKLGGLPLQHHPGSQFLYSVSTDVAGPIGRSRLRPAV